jgi:hypothetical protein
MNREQFDRRMFLKLMGLSGLASVVALGGCDFKDNDLDLEISNLSNYAYENFGIELKCGSYQQDFEKQQGIYYEGVPKQNCLGFMEHVLSLLRLYPSNLYPVSDPKRNNLSVILVEDLWSRATRADGIYISYFGRPIIYLSSMKEDALHHELAHYFVSTLDVDGALWNKFLELYGPLGYGSYGDNLNDCKRPPLGFFTCHGVTSPWEDAADTLAAIMSGEITIDEKKLQKMEVMERQLGIWSNGKMNDIFFRQLRESTDHTSFNPWGYP